MEESGRGKNGVPVLERAMDLLGILERSERGETIRELTVQLDLPRSTVYRILNTFSAHDIVRRNTSGAYLLGTRLLALAGRVRPAQASYDLVALATPFLQKLAEQTGEPCKLSLRDGDRALVIAAALGSHEYSPTPAAGTNYPLHAGAASKLILAHLPAEELEALLKGPLERFTSRTIVEPAKLKAELGRIRRQGFARDQGEHGASVHAIAAPVFEPGGGFVAALSIPFLGDKDVPTRDKLKDAVVRMAAVISAAIPPG
ncbi:MAG TPA: IclR family transcriptional regulator [Devosiaceae bacterium]|nr:IclR family transcriptional regulator [Devosiaceae bacterium]